MGEGARVPEEIVSAINRMLRPYGEFFAPGKAESRESRGYVNWKGAVEYTHLSKSTLQRAIKSGELAEPHKLAKAKNGAVVFEIAELDRYIRSH